MTGWQGNDQGWQQQPEPDPYAYDPADPYGYGKDPYAQYPPQYSTGSFAAQPPPPPPPKRSKLPMILSLVAIVLIVGAVVGIVLWQRNKDEPSATPGDDGTSETRESPSERPPSERNTTQQPADDWTVVDNKAEAGLTYSVPPNWTLSNEPRQSGEQGVEFGGVAEYGNYDCEGKPYVRSFAASGDVQGRGGTDADPTETVKHFAGTFAAEYFGDDATVEVGEPAEQDVNGTKAMTVTAKVTPEANACVPTTAEVAIVGVPVAKEGQPAGVTMLVVVNAVAGGPDEPKPTDSEQVKAILATVKAG